jgi:hypothetical protein
LVGGGAADATWAAVSILSTISTPNKPSAATMAIIAIDVVLSCPAEWFICNKLTKVVSFIYSHTKAPKKANIYRL